MKRNLLLEYRNYNCGALRTVSGARPFSSHQFRYELEKFLDESVDRPSQRDLIDLDYSLYSDIYLLEHPAANNLTGFNTREIRMVRDTLVNLCDNYHNKKLHVLFPLKSDDLKIVLNSYDHRREKSNGWFPDIKPIIYKAYCNEITFLGHRVCPKQKILYSDSHGHMIWNPEYHIHKFMYGKTLYGFLKEFQFEEFNSLTKELLTFFFGTIDIHHHLPKRPIEETKRLAQDYAEFLNWLYHQGKTRNVKVYTPLKPYPAEDRGVKRAYWYKGAPVSGSYEDRLFIWNTFVNTLDKYLVEEIQLYYPKEEIDFKDSKIYEPQKGIHLRHIYYDWDFVRNCKNNKSIWSKLI